MSTEIKNTLFRFVTMRAPELLEKESVDKKFVQHPDLTSCFFSQYLADPQYAATTKRETLINAATFWGSRTETYKSREEVRSFIENSTSVDANFYDFAIWLTSNRSTLRLDDLDKKLNYLGSTQRAAALHTNLNDNQRVDLWNNLIYQIISYKSSYVREAILSVLVADFFLKNYTLYTNNEKELRKLAQSRVIMPKELFSPEEIITASTSNKSLMSILSITPKETRKTLEIIHFEEQVKDLNLMLGEVNAAEKKYIKQNSQLLSEYEKDHQAKVNQAYANATKIETKTIDPLTQKEVVTISYENLVLPVYNFIPLNEFEFLLNGKNSDSILYSFVKKTEAADLKELKEFISDGLKKLTQKLFDRASSTNKVVSTGGVVLPVNTASVFRTSNTLTISATPSHINKRLIFTLNGMEAGTEIVSGSYTLSFPGFSETYTSDFTGEDSWINGQLVIKVPISVLNPQTPIQDGDFTITGLFISNVGRELFIDGSGSIEIIDPSNPGGSSGSQIEYIAAPDNNFINYREILPGVNFSVTGIGDYNYEDKVVISTGPGDSGNNTTGTGTGTGTGTTNTTTTQTTIQYIPSGYGIKRLGIADYRKVEQEVCCYVPGEVSHIENIMAREYKEKSTRRLRRQEDTLTTSKEKETEKLSDTTSTERFEMNQEVGSVLLEQNSFGMSGSVHQDWTNGGMMANTDFANNTSQEESNHQAVTNAKEITERALDRVVQKVKEERVTKIIEEFEENNKHGYDNRKGDKHVSGVYRWVDKIFRNRVVNYGKRLMYEFMIPEPASFHNKAIEGKDNDISGVVLEKPVDPRTASGTLELKDYNNDNLNVYAHWAAIYNIDVEQLPKNSIAVGKSFSFTTPEVDGGNFDEVAGGNGEITIPEGYYVTTGKANWHATDEPGYGMQVILGNKRLATADEVALSSFVNTIPVSYTAVGHHSGCVNFEVTCVLSAETKKQWQMETFNAIISAYETKLAEYNEKLAQLKATQSDKVRTNPLFYRKIENTVLRKNCIEYLANHATLGRESLLKDITDVTTIRAKYEDPNLESYATKVKFFEQAFEWDLMSYHFYPFYWSFKQNWKEKYNVDETDDHIFRAFLQSGMARVILTVRPGFEEAVNWYMATGQIWNGGQVPTMNDPLFISIVEELREPEGEVEETWESRVPTSLTVIQAGSIGLNVQGLPCDTDCDDFKQFDSDGNPALNPDGTPVSINPIQQNVDVNNNDVLLGNVAEDLETVTESIEEIQADIEEIKATLAASSGN